MRVAHDESGVKEIPGSAMSPRIRQYYGATRGQMPFDDEVPWCSAFVCWCLEQAGYVSTRSKAARSFLHFGNILAAPRYGSIIVFSRASPKNINAAHVGFYAGPADAGRVWVLGGNQGDKVGISQRSMREHIGSRWPVDKLHA
jgi:uncharacterized protein (TIGR02594 family)